MKPNRWTPNPNRHLWNNNGTWWMRWTPYDPLKTERQTWNLGTKDVNEARRKRDEIVANWNRKEAA
ncbi:MAG: hypothetical protein FGM15_12675 [Chthoniobacterales bacterium]|nr:hypothetical protein [Chthoniobacterales bacterium]